MCNILNWAKSNPSWWASAILKPMPMPDERFVIRKGIHTRASVNIHQVVGTDHPDYMNKDWMYLLEQGRRMTRRLKDLAENPGYYLATDFVRDPSWRLATFDGGVTWYVDGDGNHRSCIARFYLERLIDSRQKESAFVHGIQARFVQMDEAMRTVVNFVEANYPNYLIRIEPKQVRRDDGVGWYMDTLGLNVHVQDRKCAPGRPNAHVTVNDATALLQWVRDRDKRWFSRAISWVLPSNGKSE